MDSLPQDTSAYVYVQPSHPAFKKHKGRFSLDDIARTLADYRTYVKGRQRSVPLDLWLGTALQESGFGKYDDGSTMQSLPPIDFDPSKSAFDSPERYSRTLAQHLVPKDWSAQVLKSQEYPGQLYDQATTRAQVHSSSLPQTLREMLRARQHALLWQALRSPDFNLDADFAAFKLDEGVRKFKSPKKAARWYNYYDKTPRERLPDLGRDVLKNTSVQSLAHEMGIY